MDWLTISNSSQEFWENRDVKLGKDGLVKEIYVWTEHDERVFVRKIGTESSRGIIYAQDWWLKKYIENNEGRTERHATAGVIEARRLLTLNKY